MATRCRTFATIGALLLVASTRGWAGPGDLDHGFGTGGRLQAYGHSLLLPDDRLLIAYGARITRYDSNGNIDPTFGDGGVALIPLPDAAADFLTQYTTATLDGGLLVAGHLLAADSTEHSPEVVLRLDSEGRVVTSFGGQGDGFYRVPVVARRPGVLVSRLTAIVVDADGRIVMAERSWTGAFCDGADVVARLSAQGLPDPTFGADGRSTLGFCGGRGLFGARSDGSIVIGGPGGLFGLSAHGAIDPAFGEDGHVLHGLPAEWTGARLLPDGSILIVGRDSAAASAEVVFTRLDRNGQLDADLGAGTGSVRLDPGAAFLGVSGLRPLVHDFVLTSDAAHVYLQLTLLNADGTAACAGGIARILGDGTPDISFGKQGLTCLDYGSFSLKKLVGAQRDGSPLFEVWYDAFYRLLVDATPSPGMLTMVRNAYIVHVGEADGHVIVPVVRTAGYDGAVSLSFATGPRRELGYNDDLIDRHTTPDIDYQSASGRLDWADGDEGQREITITILDDEVDETDEFFSIQISDPQGGALTQEIGDASFVHVAIDDDDGATPPTTTPPPTSTTGGGGGGGKLSWATLLLVAGLLSVAGGRAARLGVHISRAARPRSWRCRSSSSASSPRKHALPRRHRPRAPRIACAA